jgi:hypothetical protein
MVITFAAHVALTPAGKPFAPETPLLEIPVATVVLCVMFVSSGVLIHKVGVDDAAETVFSLTVMVPVALTVPQLPISGIAIKGME